MLYKEAGANTAQEQQASRRLTPSYRLSSQVLMEMINCDGAAFRCRSAKIMRGRDGKLGGLIGLEFNDAVGCWENGVLAGIGGDAEGEGGLCPADDHVIKAEVCLCAVCSVPCLRSI